MSTNSVTLTELAPVVHPQSLPSLEAAAIAPETATLSRDGGFSNENKTSKINGGREDDVLPIEASNERSADLSAQDAAHAVSAKETWRKPRINVARMAAVSLVSWLFPLLCVSC